MEVFESLPAVSEDCVPRVRDTTLDSLHGTVTMFMDVFLLALMLALPT